MSRASRRAIALAAAAIGALLLLRNLIVPAPLDVLDAGRDGDRNVHQGSWYFPRGGPYVLGFESPGGPASLAIDGAVVASGAGEVLERHVYAEPGARAVRFEAPPGARLLWHPPGRRGDPEYVPPSSLSPEPPDAARFPAWVGASPVDGGIAIAIVLILAALTGYLARHALRRIDRRAALAAAAVFLVALAVRLVGLGDQGQTWDEDANWSAGRNYVTNLLSLDFSASSWRWNLEHPPLMKYLAGIGAQLADGYGPARAISALLMAAACAMLVPLGRRLLSPAVGILAGLFAAFTPHLVGHGQIVGHEAPSALLWTVALYLALRAHDPSDRPDPRRLERRLLVLGVVVGLAISERFVNGLLAPLLGVVLLLEAPPEARRRTLVLGLTLVPLVVLATAFLLWPRLWSAPIAHLGSALGVLTSSPSIEPFLGAITETPGRSYFLVYLVATAPLGLLAAAAIWPLRVVRLRERGSLYLALWLLVPLLVLLSPVRRDGVRYILPALLALDVAAAAGLAYAAAALGRWVGGRRRATWAAGVALTGYLAVVCARIQPYYLDYYGEHVGGPARVAERRALEIAWWGEGVAEAVAYLNRHAAPGARVHKRCVWPSHLTWLRGDLWAAEVQDPARAEWILVYQPTWMPCPLPPGAELAHEVSAGGAPLARVYRVR